MAGDPDTDQIHDERQGWPISHGKLTPLADMRYALEYNYYLFVLAWSSMFKELIDEKGEEGRRMAARASENMGIKWGEAMLSVTGRSRQETSAAEVAKAYSESMQYFGYDNSIVESTEKRAVVRVTKCPLLEHWRRQYPELIPHACYVEPYVDIGSYRYINPAIHVEIPCKLSEGSPYSDYVITVADESEGPFPELVDQGTEKFKEFLAKRQELLSQKSPASDDSRLT
ncbi:MAG: L-2-amino-thiazoline-4-carboxylic acid hydrolase [Candidatus Dormibacteria bacterium]|jgi:hypothetical protein